MGHGNGRGEAGGRGQGQGQGRGRGDTGAMAGVICFIIVVALLVLAFIGLCIAKAVMGKEYFNDCPKQYLIPVYLIVSGSVPLLMGGLLKRDDGEINVFNIIGAIGFLFQFAWLICGSVWVFGIYSDVMDGCGGAKDCCNPSLMKFAFAVTIVDWVFLGLIVVVVCFLFGVIMCCVSDEEEESTGTELKE
ncbi:transmembrane protein 272-like [Mercenaria mercenaria]|uniref:transmembrane protein 272-like n=1 Tax=Mercenaria mercenaria TaxID=6596 RepID=UPI001E1DB638|nr:transmembrane protein 272-like [Mercenaria mercenaria]XP_045178883.1 transmembrane protein 272-like [Mercenaria mercenaria]XP_045178884.1 transmembrane protein 272-like [Mercenaria mercenaria]XP_045178885.1 transmembrane protein 272-like [Mercenaria mercenaria]